VQIYHDFMLAFANEFHPWFHTILSKVQIGMGPAGELRYPSFPLSEWGYPGSGDFVCFDTHMKAMWKQHCEKVLHKNEWANRFPDHSHYNTPPEARAAAPQREPPPPPPPPARPRASALTARGGGWLPCTGEQLLPRGVQERVRARVSHVVRAGASRARRPRAHARRRGLQAVPDGDFRQGRGAALALHHAAARHRVHRGILQHQRRTRPSPARPAAAPQRARAARVGCQRGARG